MQILLVEVCIGISVYNFKSIFYSQLRINKPLLYLLNCFLDPIELLGLLHIIYAVHISKEGFVVDDMRVVFIHIIKQIGLFIFSKWDDFIYIFQPTLVSDEPTIDLIYFSEQVVETYFLLD